MKPAKLVMSAFGPYGGLMPEIDFEKFEENGLFLITGDTGAGKTTIFDAICYALFGEVSGTYRDVKNLRSEYADKDTETFVEFTFTHQGREYVAKRKPAYMRPSKRGGGYTEEKAGATLYENGKVIADGTSRVEAKVKEILGVDDKQFKQIAMIAQGEFWKLLNASTAERTAILRTIFMTDGYTRMTEILRERMKVAKNTRDEHERSIIQYFNDVQGEGLDELKARALESGSVWNMDELLEAVESCIENDRKLKEEAKDESISRGKEYDDAQAKLTAAKADNEALDKVKDLREKKGALLSKEGDILNLESLIDKQKKASHTVMPSYSEWRKAAGNAAGLEKDISAGEIKLKAIEGRLSSAAERLSKFEAAKPKAESVKAEIRKIEEDREKYSRRDTLKAEYANLEAEAKALAEQEKRISEEEIAVKENIDRLSGIKEKLKDSPVKLTEEAARRDSLKKLSGTAFDIVFEMGVELPGREEQLKKAQGKYADAKEIYDRALEEANRMETAYEAEKAGILAQKLVDGEKCPVCGSVHHPEPAVLSDEAVTEGQLKEAKAALAPAEKVKSKALAGAEGLKEGLKAYKEGLDKRIAEVLKSDPLCGSIDNIEAAETRLKEMYQESKAKTEELEKAAVRLKDAENAINKAEGDRDRLAEEKGNLDEKVKANVGNTAAVKGELEGLSGLTYETRSKAEAVLADYMARLDKFEKGLNAAEEEKRNAEGAKAEAEGSLKTKKDTLTGLREEVEKLYAVLESRLKECGFGSTEEMVSLAVTEEKIKEEEKKTAEYRDALAGACRLLEEAEKEAEGRTYSDLASLKAEADAKKEEMDLAGKKVGSIEERIKANLKRKTNMEDRREALEDTQKEYSICSKLYGLVNGTGGEKITLEQYVQAAGFDRILKAANRRLLPMSDGQFELYRAESASDKRKGTFLDLEVQDNYTGKRRPVGNLSGGESFKASLSLALGLSDTVSSSLGGLQMDALFIDEGFGTLDRKSIDNAMNIILDLSKAGRITGIISHREELAAQIGQQIIVTKTRDGGSSVKTVTD